MKYFLRSCRNFTGLLVSIAFLFACGPSNQGKVSGSFSAEKQQKERVLSLPVFESDAVAIEQEYSRAIAAAESALKLITQETTQAAAFDSNFGAFARMQQALFSSWYRIYLLNNVSTDAAVRQAAEQAVIDFDGWYIERVSLNRELYLSLKASAEELVKQSLDSEERRFMRRIIDDYEQQGMGLGEEERELFKQKQLRLSELLTSISSQINDDRGAVDFTSEDLLGLSPEQMQRLEYNAATQRYTVETATTGLYKLVSSYAKSPKTRLAALKARLQRAQQINGPLILEVVQLRFEIAQMLGFSSWADLQTSRKMAGTGARALQFVSDLDQKLDARFAAEKARLQQLKAMDLQLGQSELAQLNYEDLDYYSNILMQSSYQIDQENVRRYFPESVVVPGVFAVLGELFGLQFQERFDVPLWAEDVRFFQVSDAASGRILGGVYLDLHPREGKYNHFAEFALVDGAQLQDGSYQAPLCAIVGNFPKADAAGQSLWSFDELGTMIHEMAHSIQHVVTRARFAEFSGTNVPQDYVEVASQVLERMLEEPAIISRLSAHQLTGEALPEDVLQNIWASKRALLGHAYKRQMGFAYTDLHLHMYEQQADVPQSVDALYAASNRDLSRIYKVPDDTALLASFEHLFVGYDAGYYGYAWADVIAADLAKVFRDSPKGFLDSTKGLQLRRTIYELGDSQDVEDTLRAFLGREWNSAAFFEDLSESRGL